MTKRAPRSLWHKRQDKMLSSKCLNVQNSCHRSIPKKGEHPQQPTQRFWNHLKAQIQKSLGCLIVVMTGVFGGGCQPQPSKPPDGIWQRQSVFVNGVFRHERKASFIFEKSNFRYFEGGCEAKGVVVYQPAAMILAVQESDCPGMKFADKIHIGFDVDADGQTLRLTRDNPWNDSIREVYHLRGSR